MKGISMKEKTVEKGGIKPTGALSSTLVASTTGVGSTAGAAGVSTGLTSGAGAVAVTGSDIRE